MKIVKLIFTTLLLAITTIPNPNTHAQTNSRFYAVVAPFNTIADEISFDALNFFWQGDANALKPISNESKALSITLDEETRGAMTALMGEPKNARIRVVNANDVANTVWRERSASLAILPFDKLDHRLKLLRVNGLNLFEKNIDVSAYPLRASGAPNRDPNKMLVVAMTGVTALVRGTAVKMEQKGVAYPAARIRDWLRNADIAHISNEVSFWDKCPKPSFLSGVVMCSDPKYIELLKDVGTDIIELTGNHLWDRGWQNLNTTIDVYESLGWEIVGGGRNDKVALRPLKYDLYGNKIAFVGCNWFGNNWATETKPGSARCGSKSPRDLDLITAEIRRLRGEGFLVIAMIQYGEFYTYNAPIQQQRDFNTLREAGAIIVNGSQGHHAQGFAINDKGFIHYGVGNLFFGDQSALGARQTFVDRHVFYDGKYLGVDLRTAFILDSSQPVPMNETDRAKLLRTLFVVSVFE
jgi:poly-gamma-glutamate synthesis protein (capsule biosynthesis protein)